MAFVALNSFKLCLQFVMKTNEVKMPSKGAYAMGCRPCDPGNREKATVMISGRLEQAAWP